VVYVITVVVRATLFVVPQHLKGHQILGHIMDVVQITNLALSLFTNVLATAIISAKAWCVCTLLKRNGARLCDARVRQKETPQVVIGECREQRLSGKQNIGSPR
jgi:hypothetical protein